MRKKPTRILTAYNYTDHDPVLDEMRTMWQDSGLKLVEVAEASGLSVKTLRNWFVYVSIDSPQHRSVMAFKRALGYDSRDFKSSKPVSINAIRRGARFVEVKWRGNIVTFPQKVAV